MTGDIEARLSVVETRFDHCQNQMNTMIKDIKEDNRDMKRALKDITVKLDNQRNAHANSVLEMRKDVLNTMAIQYERKSDVQKQLTDLRLSMRKDIDQERKRVTATLWAIVVGIVGVATLFGWLYVNVLPHGATL